jgi:hypothetical protein
VGLDSHGLFSGGSILLGLLALRVETDVSVLDFWVGGELLRENLRLILARKSSTTCS